MKLDSSRNVFTSDTNEILNAEELIERESEFLREFPNYELSTSYWNVNFEYYRLDESKEKMSQSQKSRTKYECHSCGY